MPILTRFYSVAMPLENLIRVLTIDELKLAIKEANPNGKVWFDGYLYCEQSMSPNDNGIIVKFWEDKGLVPIEIKDGKKYWKDLCIVGFPDTKATLPCDWIKIFTVDSRGCDLYVSLKNKPKDLLIKEPMELEEFMLIIDKL